MKLPRFLSIFMKPTILEKYPSVEIVAEHSKCTIRYMECSRDGDHLRFERKEKSVPLDLASRLVRELLEDGG